MCEPRKIKCSRYLVTLIKISLAPPFLSTILSPWQRSLPFSVSPLLFLAPFLSALDSVSAKFFQVLNFCFNQRLIMLRDRKGFFFSSWIYFLSEKSCTCNLVMTYHEVWVDKNEIIRYSEIKPTDCNLLFMLKTFNPMRREGTKNNELIWRDQ